MKSFPGHLHILKIDLGRSNCIWILPYPLYSIIGQCECCMVVAILLPESKLEWETRWLINPRLWISRQYYIKLCFAVSRRTWERLSFHLFSSFEVDTVCMQLNERGVLVHSYGNNRRLCVEQCLLCYAQGSWLMHWHKAKVAFPLKTMKSGYSSVLC